MTAYLQKLRLFSRDVRAYLLFKTLESFAVWGIRAMLLNLYLLRLGYGPEFIGMFNAAGLLAFALFGLPASAIGARWGSRRTLIAGAGVLLVGFWLLPLADLVPFAWRTGWLYATNVGVLLGAALYYINGTPFLMGATRAEARDHAFSAQAALTPLAGFAGNLLGGLLPRLFASLLDLPLEGPAAYRYPLWIAAALMVPALLALLGTREMHVGHAPAPARTTAKGRPPYELILSFALFTLLRNVGAAMGGTFLNIYLDDHLHVSTAQIGLLLAIGQIVAAPAALLMPFLVARWGRTRTVVLGTLGAALSMLPQALIPHWSAAGAGLMATNALTAIATAAYTVYTQESVPKRWRSTMSGAFFVAATLGMAAAASGGGYVVSALGYPGLFMTGAGMVVLSTLFFWGRFCAPREKRVSRPVIKAADQA
jgi:MFS family permease